MGNLIGGRMAIEAHLARLAYVSLYRRHLIAIHGWVRGTALIAVGHVKPDRATAPEAALKHPTPAPRPWPGD